MMLSHVLHSYGLNLMIAEALLKDLSADQMCQQPSGLINHPAWSIGHLAFSGHQLCEMIGIASSLPEGWDATFKAGTPPDPDSTANPAKDELMAVHRRFHERIGEAVPTIDQATLDQPHPNESVRTYFPTVGDMLVFMMTGHEMDHLGQIAAWRRAMGLKPAM